MNSNDKIKETHVRKSKKYRFKLHRYVFRYRIANVDHRSTSIVNKGKRTCINGGTMAIISAIYFLAGRKRTAMRASLTPTLTTPHVCLMADPRSLPGLLTICGGLTSRYPITAHRVPARSFLFIVSRIRPGVSPLFAPLVTYADQFCHSRDAFVPEKLSRFYYFFFSFFFFARHRHRSSMDMHCHVVYLIHAKVAECRFNGAFF